LVSVVAREVPLSSSPGAEPCGVYLEPGFPLPPTVASWISVHLDHPVAIDGWVPSSARGVSRDRPFATRANVQLQPFVLVHDAPAIDSSVVAIFDEGALALPGQPGTWVAVDAVADRVRVVGWAVVPEVDLTRPKVKVFDFSGDTIEGDLVRPEGIRD
jgi:hypothetical protein